MTTPECRKRRRPHLSTRLLRIESLERRDLMSVDVIIGAEIAIGDRQLRILGTDSVDQVTVAADSFGRGIRVTQNGRTQVIGERVDNIYFEGFGGDDQFINLTMLPAIILGGEGDDHLVGGGNYSVIVGGDGNDQIDGGPGSSIIYGDVPTKDTMTPSPYPRDFDWGRASGNDVIQCGDEGSVVYGGPGNDRIMGSAQMDDIWGGAGDDQIDCGAGIDIVDGGPGDDLIRGGPGNDLLVGNDGNDILLGEEGNDLLHGCDGRDLLIGGDGQDVLNGSSTDVAALLPTTRGAEPGDILIGGTTDYDANDRALMALLDAWTQDVSRSERIAALQSGIGLLLGYALNNRTVHRDHFADVFEEISKYDWIFE